MSRWLPIALLVLIAAGLAACLLRSESAQSAPTPPSEPPAVTQIEDDSFFRSAPAKEQMDRVLAAPRDTWWCGTYEGTGFETLVVSSAGYYFEKGSDLGMACESWGEVHVEGESLVFVPTGQRVLAADWRIPRSVHPVRCAVGRWLVRGDRWDAFVPRFRGGHVVPRRGNDWFHEQGFDDETSADCVLTTLSGQEL